MGKNSAIEWTNNTWNPWQGCVKVSQGCKNCYMYRDKKRYRQDPTTVVRSSRATFNKPLTWKEPALVFTCSWSDFFIEEADGWRDDAWKIIRQTPHLTYQILTKRPENIIDRLPIDWGNGWGNGWPNVWLGVSVEMQRYADERIPILVSIPATVKFLSCEPLLGAIDLQLAGFNYGRDSHHEYIDWVIAGGESGPNYRPADLEWFRSIRDQCQSANIPFFFKQIGGSSRIDGVWGGRELDGRTWSEMPQERS